MNIPQELRDQILGYPLTTTKEIPVKVCGDGPAIIHSNSRYARRLDSSETHWMKTRHQAFEQAHTGPQLYPQVLRVCHQLYAEGVPLLYSQKHQALIWLPDTERVLPYWYRDRDDAPTALSILHECPTPSDPLDLKRFLKGTRSLFHQGTDKWAFLLQPRESRLNTLTNVTIRHYLSVITRDDYTPEPENVMRFLLKYGRKTLKLLPQVETLTIEMHLPAKCWYIPQYRGLTWYPHGYTHCPAHVPSNVVIKETREAYVSRIEDWMRSSVRLAGQPFDHHFGVHERIAKCLKMVVKQEVVLYKDDVHPWAAWLWDEEACAEGVERACEPQLTVKVILSVRFGLAGSTTTPGI